MSPWVFVLVLAFSGDEPVFGRTVELTIRAESASACVALRRMLVKELTGFGIRHTAGECGRAA